MTAPTGGGNVEQLIGRIVIDSSGVRTTEQDMKRLGQTTSEVSRLITGAFSALSLGALTATTQRVRGINTQFSIMLGNEQEAQRQLDKIRQAADRAGQPFLDLVESAGGFLSIMRSTNAQFDTLLSLAQRLQVLDPTARQRDVQVALREFASGDSLSLARRFEISRDVARGFLEQANGDTQKSLELLSEYLDTLGITQSALEDMGASGAYAFQQFGSELQEAIATGFEPLLTEFLIPITRHASEFLSTLREVNPEILRLVTNVGALVAAGTAAEKFGLEGAQRSALVAASAGLGVELGLDISSRVSGKSPEETQRTFDKWLIEIAYIISGLGITFADFINTLEDVFGWVQLIFASMLENIQQIIADIAPGDVKGPREVLQDQERALYDRYNANAAEQERIRQQIAEGQIDPAEGHDRLVTLRRDAEETWKALEEAGRAVRDFGVVTQERFDREFATNEELQKQRREDAAQLQRDLTRTIAEITGTAYLLDEAVGELGDTAGEAASQIYNAADSVVQFTDDQVKAFGEFQADLAEIRADADADRLAEEDAYTEQVQSVTEKRKAALLRDAEDEARRVIRAQDELARRIQKVRDGIVQREIDAAENTEAAEKTQKFLDDQQKRYDKFYLDMERADEDHLDRLNEAGSRLDAAAVSRELQDYAKQRRRKLEDFDLQQADQQDQFIAQQQQERAAGEQRLAEQKAADETRIQEMIADFDRQEALRAEDRDIRLQREADAFQAERDQMDAAHQARLTQIDQQERAALDAREAAFVDTWNQLVQDAGQGQEMLIAVHREGQAAIETQLRAWYSRQARVAQSALSVTSTGTSGPVEQGDSGFTQTQRGTTAAREAQRATTGVSGPVEQGDYGFATAAERNAYLAAQAARQQAERNATHQQVLTNLEVRYGNAGLPSTGSLTRTPTPFFAAGGLSPGGLVHTEPGEGILTPARTQMIQDALGGRFDQDAIVSAVRGAAGGGGGIEIGQLVVNNQLPANASPAEYAAATQAGVRQAIRNFMLEMAGQGTGQ